MKRAPTSVMVDILHIPGCVSCARNRRALHEAAKAIAGDGLIWRDLDVIEHMDYAVSLGVLTLPALAINGQLAFSTLPTPQQLRRALRNPPLPQSSDGP